jgi:hypothetical protein
MMCMIELPSMYEIEEMDKQRLQAVESLEISEDKVKCQYCDRRIPLLPRILHLLIIPVVGFRDKSF